MKLRYQDLSKTEQMVYQTVGFFMRGRLEERAALEWALTLQPRDTIKRLALLDLLDSPQGWNIREPWRTAWRLIEESWSNLGSEDRSASSLMHARRRIQAGERSGSLIAAIVDLVSPRLQVELLSQFLHSKTVRNPKHIKDLLRPSLTSGKIVDPGGLGIRGLDDGSFLVSLAKGLEASVTKGLEIARRLGWKEKSGLGPLGGLQCVYYVPRAERGEDQREPIELGRGIAPAVKLLHAVVARLAEIDLATAKGFVERYKAKDSPIYLRLWAALSRDAQLMPADEVSSKLLSLDDQKFWDVKNFPEIAELRAKRFAEFTPQAKEKIAARIRKRPPRHLWPKKLESFDFKQISLYWALREMKRLEITGANLPKRDKDWLQARITEFPGLVQMTRITDGFWPSFKGRWATPNPDDRYDLLAGKRRLQALEAAFSSSDVWEDDPASRAWDWIMQPGKPLLVLKDLESTGDSGTALPKVWDRFGWMHSPAPAAGEDMVQRNLAEESERVLKLLAFLPDATIRQAIDGIAQWLSTWKKQVVQIPQGPQIWLKLWPMAVEATNAQEPVEEKINLSAATQATDKHKPVKIDTLNTPAGKFVDVFLAACPNLQRNARPFDVGNILRDMRTALIASIGRSKLIVQHRLIEALPYFLRADSDWTHEHLITPLTMNNDEAIALWQAIARRTQFTDVLQIVGERMTERAIDLRLDRETRKSLVFSLVVECLYALQEKREPAVPYSRIQQMIRSLDDEVRAHGAEVVRRFILDLSTSSEGEEAPSPEDLFRASAKPFLQQVWPQEYSLATPGVSRALASLPATAGEAFVEAVDTIEPFLVPFECWSMIEYGLFDEEDDNPKLSFIDTPEKGAAFFRLMDLTIGKDESAVIPDDLAEALYQIRRVAPQLAKDTAFRRLATASRRG